jgi:hypothetical protein
MGWPEPSPDHRRKLMLEMIPVPYSVDAVDAGYRLRLIKNDLHLVELAVEGATRGLWPSRIS